MVHFLDTGPTDITVAGSRWPIDVTSETEFDSIDFNSF